MQLSRVVHENNTSKPGSNNNNNNNNNRGRSNSRRNKKTRSSGKGWSGRKPSQLYTVWEELTEGESDFQAPTPSYSTAPTNYARGQPKQVQYGITYAKVPSSSKNQASCASSAGDKKKEKEEVATGREPEEWPTGDLRDFLIPGPRAREVGWDVAGLSEEQISALEQDILYPLNITGYLIKGRAREC